MRKMFLTAAAVTVALSAGPASAATIAGLFNTGTGAGNVALPGGDGVTDPHYLIFASTTPGIAGNQAVTFKHPSYAAEDADSRWISISSTGTPGSNTTSYRLTFDLTGFDFTTALITGSWGVDNDGVISINSVPTANVLTGGGTGNFTSLHGFSIGSGFIAGINTIDFVVTDLGAPTALRVDNIAGTASLVGASAVPEPETWAMMLFGLGAAGVVLRRKRRPGLAQAV